MAKPTITYPGVDEIVERDVNGQRVKITRPFVEVPKDNTKYIAKWGNKGFVTTPEKVVPIWDLTTSFAMKDGNTIDTSGDEVPKAAKREAQRITFKTRYVKALGVDPKDQMKQWYDEVGKRWPMYIGGVQFGPPLLELEDVKWSNFLHAPDGDIIAADAEIHLVEWYEGIELDQGWVKLERETEDGNLVYNTGSVDDLFSAGLDKEKLIWSFLRMQGFSAAATAGVMGNMWRESHLIADQNELQPGWYGYGYGLVQWTNTNSDTSPTGGARRKKLENWCAANGYDVKSYEGQLKYLIYEYELAYAQKFGYNFKQSTDVYKATWDWLKYFEGVEGDAFAERLQHANTYYGNYKDYTTFLTSPSTGGTTSGAGVTTGTWLWPLPGVSSCTILGGGGADTHNAGDFRVQAGCNLVAVDGGVVVSVQDWDGKNAYSYYRLDLATYGTSVLIKHSNGYYSRYAHMTTRVVQAGQKVAQGQFLGTSGNTGRSFGPHLHLEIYPAGAGFYQGLWPGDIQWKR